MGRLWNKTKKLWRDYWKDDTYDTSVKHLSQADKRTLWYGGGLFCSGMTAVCLLITAISNLHIGRRNDAYVEEAMNMIATYMASATGDEYDGIVRTIRHDLVFSEYNQCTGNLIQYIPNTSEICRLDTEELPARIYLVCANTGEFYPLDLFMLEDSCKDGTGEGIIYSQNNSTNGGDEGTVVSFGYDEISRTSLQIVKKPEQGEGSVTLCRDSGIVSVQRMKALFCDDCISRMLNAVENCCVGEFVILDKEERIFYPVDDGATLQIGDYTLEIVCINKDYKIILSVYLGG